MLSLDNALKSVAVIGAAGKMGSGIAALLLQEMARCEAAKTGKIGTGEYSLILIDQNAKALFNLKQQLRHHLIKYAEKNINSLRGYFANNPKLISNEEVVRAFVEGAMDFVCIDTDVTKAKDTTLVFEAIIEDVDAKNALYNTLKTVAKNDQYYLTNTSSIPISLLNETCLLNNRIIGFHFYNPPIVQKLIEIIEPENMNSNLSPLAHELAKRLQKTVIQAHDIAGFIGNGHFIREALFACQQARELARDKKWPLEQAIMAVNKVTQELLIRPMGLFQLMDYVGLDVCQNIAKIMKTYLPDPTLHDELLDAMVDAGISGGQNQDNTQKNGFLQYDRQTIIGVYSLKEKRYISVADLQPSLDKWINPLPDGYEPWKRLHNDPDRDVKLVRYFSHLQDSNSEAAQLAKKFLAESQRIAEHLVQTGVAEQMKNIDAVLKLGFFHLSDNLKRVN